MNTDLFALDSPLASSAVFSPCGRYRYELWRRWAEGPHVLFIMLNPSTADATVNDPTIRKCISYAKAWGYGALCVANLFAWRATDPKDMKAAHDPIGPENNITLHRLMSPASKIIAAWGKHGRHLDRDQRVMAMIPSLHCLARNVDGTPCHPLYLPGSLTPTAFSP